MFAYDIFVALKCSLFLVRKCLLFVADNKDWRTTFYERITVKKLCDDLLPNQEKIKCDIGITHLLVTACS